MSSPIDTVKGILPIPENVELVTDPEKEDLANAITDEPTLSHSLAVMEPEEKGVAQEQHDEMVQDLGWHEPDDKIPSPLVGGLPNEELWLLIRRFNKQIYDVREIRGPAAGGLDINVADEESFSPDKLRASLERLYMTVIIGVLSMLKHIARLRSWREFRRTASFLAVYSVAWLFDLVVPLLSLTAIVLIVYPPSREFLFPPAPLALISAKSGGIQKPKAGVLGSTDSATGAPENLKGEAVEAEASTFVTGIASVALASASGKHPADDPINSPNPPEDDAANKMVPDPTGMAAGAGAARAGAVGDSTAVTHRRAKVPMENAMWSKMRPIMHGINDVSDSWERFGNALSPTPPFPKEVYRLRLAGLLVPVFAASIFITSYMVRLLRSSYPASPHTLSPSCCSVLYLGKGI